MKMKVSVAVAGRVAGYVGNQIRLSVENGMWFKGSCAPLYRDLVFQRTVYLACRESGWSTDIHNTDLLYQQSCSFITNVKSAAEFVSNWIMENNIESALLIEEYVFDALKHVTGDLVFYGKENSNGE